MQWKVLFLVEIPSSNLGTVFGPSPLVQEVLTAPDETLDPDMNLIIFAVLESCLSHHESLEVAKFGSLRQL